MKMLAYLCALLAIGWSRGDESAKRASDEQCSSYAAGNVYPGEHNCYDAYEFVFPGYGIYRMK